MMGGLQPGDILLTRSNNFIGFMIRLGEFIHIRGWINAIKRLVAFLTRSGKPLDHTDPAWVNHCAVYIGNGQVIEALADGLTLSPVTKYHDNQYIVVRLSDVKHDVTDADRQDLVDFAHTELARHDRYGWLAIASIILQILTPLQLSVSWDDSMICSAFAARCLEHAGVTLPKCNPYTIMPSTFAQVFPTVLPINV